MSPARARALAGVGAVVLLASACSSGSSGTAAPSATAATGATASPTGTATTGAAVGPPASAGSRTSLQTAQLADGAGHLWPLTSVAAGAGMISDIGPLSLDGSLRGGRVVATTGPAASTTGAQFVGQGFVTTPVPAAALGQGKAFTLEFAFRSDSCSKHWTNALGTGAYVGGERLGLNVLHYPSDFANPCRMAFEFWRAGAYTGGCSTAQAVTRDTWELYALTWDGSTATCWAGGRRFGTVRGAAWTSQTGTPFGIGGAGSGWGGALDSGSLADVALYPRVLSPAQVVAHARALPAT